MDSLSSMWKRASDAAFAMLASWNADRSMRGAHVAETISREQWVATAGDASAADQHALWTACLERHVTRATLRGVPTSVVDYLAIDADPDFAAYLAQLAATETPSNPAERLAHLLNAYNATCVKVVSSAVASGALPPAAEPGASIRSLGKAVSPIWKRRVGNLGGAEVSLDEIEHGLVRAEFKDARVHACLNCASVSCPDLPSAAFEARTLDAAMDERVALWLGNAAKGVAVAPGGALLVSSIFRWYADDFAGEAGTVLGWLRQHGAPGCDGEGAVVEFADYDWGLNAPPPPPSPTDAGSS